MPTASPLAQPLPLPCGVSLPNRLFKAAMTEGLANPQDHATERHCTLYRRWAEGGSGMLLTGNVMIDRRFLERPGNVVIDNNDGEPALKAWAEAGTAAGNQLWMQISHPGRQCQRTVAARPLAPSAVKLNIPVMFGQPRAMTEADIQAALDGYARVAATAKRCGFTGVQVHAAHGYLISQFLAPNVNQRTDQWGGSLENRSRFLLEAVRRTRAAVGDAFPVAVKLNSADFSKNGFSLEDSMQVAAMLSREKIDFLEVSGGTYEQPRLLGVELGDDAETPVTAATRNREAYFLDYAQRIREVVDIPLGVTGGFRSRAFMEAALAAGELDAVGLGRPLCTDPGLPAQLLRGDVEELPAYEHGLHLGTGFMGPQSRFKLMKGLNAQAAQAWYYQQLLRLADGEEADRQLGAFKALWRHMLGEFRTNKRRET